MADPVFEGWDFIFQYCDPELWIEDGWYHQQLDVRACPPGPQGGYDAYRRALAPYNGVTEFFLEFHVETNGDPSGIPWASPVVLAMGNNAGVLYHFTVARDMVKFLRDVDLRIWFLDIEPDIPHTYRVELHGDRYAFYIDGYLVDEGLSEGPFPAHQSTITWQIGRAHV